MQNPLYLNLNREDFEHIARALAVYDHVRHRNRERKHAAGAEVSELQERWLDEGERFGAPFTDEERDRLLDDAFKEIDDFVDGETWQEFAWWIAEREWKRRAGACTDKETRDLVTDRIYHEVMDEFVRHGVDQVAIPGIPADQITPRRVADALRSLRTQTRHLKEEGR